MRDRSECYHMSRCCAESSFGWGAVEDCDGNQIYSWREVSLGWARRRGKRPCERCGARLPKPSDPDLLNPTFRPARAGLMEPDEAERPEGETD